MADSSNKPPCQRCTATGKIKKGYQGKPGQPLGAPTPSVTCPDCDGTKVQR